LSSDTTKLKGVIQKHPNASPPPFLPLFLKKKEKKRRKPLPSPPSLKKKKRKKEKETLEESYPFS